MRNDETEEERAADIRRLGTAFIQDRGYHYLARKKNGDALGYLYVPNFDDDDAQVRVRVVGHQDCGFELLTDAMLGTYKEFDCLPELRFMDQNEYTMKTMGSGDIPCYQLNYACPWEDYDPNCAEARSVTIPNNVLTAGGNINIKQRRVK